MFGYYDKVTLTLINGIDNDGCPVPFLLKLPVEQDFIIQKENNILPIEVKASTNVHSQSLKAFYEKYNPKTSVRFSLLPYQEQSWMQNIPLYAICNL
mgnify:CR=1 FL=1